MGFFDFNNPQHRQLAQAHSTGDFSQVDPQQVVNTYKGFVEHGPEDQVQAVHQEYFNQMPKVQQMGLFSSLIDAARKNGIDPSQAGVSTTDPRQATPFDLGNLFNMARSSGLLGGMFGGGQSQSGLGSLAGQLIGNQGGFSNQGGYSNQNQMPNNQPNPGGLGSILNNPIAQSALSGLIGYAASRAFGGGGNNAQAQAPVQAPNNQNLPGPQSLPPSDQGGFQNNQPM